MDTEWILVITLGSALFLALLALVVEICSSSSATEATERTVKAQRAEIAGLRRAIEVLKEAAGAPHAAAAATPDCETQYAPTHAQAGGDAAASSPPPPPPQQRPYPSQTRRGSADRTNPGLPPTPPRYGSAPRDGSDASQQPPRYNPLRGTAHDDHLGDHSNTATGRYSPVRQAAAERGPAPAAAAAPGYHAMGRRGDGSAPAVMDVSAAGLVPLVKSPPPAPMVRDGVDVAATTATTTVPHDSLSHEREGVRSHAAPEGHDAHDAFAPPHPPRNPLHAYSPQMAPSAIDSTALDVAGAGDVGGGGNVDADADADSLLGGTQPQGPAAGEPPAAAGTAVRNRVFLVVNVYPSESGMRRDVARGLSADTAACDAGVVKGVCVRVIPHRALSTVLAHPKVRAAAAGCGDERPAPALYLITQAHGGACRRLDATRTSAEEGLTGYPQYQTGREYLVGVVWPVTAPAAGVDYTQNAGTGAQHYDDDGNDASPLSLPRADVSQHASMSMLYIGGPGAGGAGAGVHVGAGDGHAPPHTDLALSPVAEDPSTQLDLESHGYGGGEYSPVREAGVYEAAVAALEDADEEAGYETPTQRKKAGLGAGGAGAARSVGHHYHGENNNDNNNNNNNNNNSSDKPHHHHYHATPPRAAGDGDSMPSPLTSSPPRSVSPGTDQRYHRYRREVVDTVPPANGRGFKAPPSQQYPHPHPHPHTPHGAGGAAWDRDSSLAGTANAPTPSTVVGGIAHGSGEYAHAATADHRFSLPRGGSTGSAGVYPNHHSDPAAVALAYPSRTRAIATPTLAAVGTPQRHNTPGGMAVAHTPPPSHTAIANAVSRTSSASRTLVDVRGGGTPVPPSPLPPAPVAWCPNDGACYEVNDEAHYTRFRHRCRIENCAQADDPEHDMYFAHNIDAQTTGSPVTRNQGVDSQSGGVKPVFNI